MNRHSINWKNYYVYLTFYLFWWWGPKPSGGILWRKQPPALTRWAVQEQTLLWGTASSPLQEPESAEKQIKHTHTHEQTLRLVDKSPLSWRFTFMLPGVSLPLVHRIIFCAQTRKHLLSDPWPSSYGRWAPHLSSPPGGWWCWPGWFQSPRSPSSASETSPRSRPGEPPTPPGSWGMPSNTAKSK